ncbi:redox-active disulfide protein 2 [Flammeovirga kamogawensis]|uniref:Redox-active disulfide protein 2 n=1 Tax=Flammeovirga kamogawensis TaxID=373891 RepID=A0ABX8H3E6_9BACT|nr:redox-active disulfide protein 2 [Flammeovirga kamogawensis]MBB6461977.1 hypothetical protein [Flammeovirga kamogawensis]QWG10419.1 hypothetical protein KM029_25930 [Flammeovirga kamogawensis]TRX63929.1 redox-active disulfide protein 2 [Flammeovirga kamogawensis]
MRKEKTTEKLGSELKLLKTSIVILTVTILVLFIVCIFGLLTMDNNRVFISIIVVPIALSAILPSQISNMKKIKVELESINKL